MSSLLPSGDWAKDGHESQSFAGFASLIEYLFAAQFVQVADPTLVLYVPAMHAVHVVPSLPV
jgi:hypothetical protein